MGKFELVSDYKPKGDQPKAISQLTDGLIKDHRYQTLLGVTGSGKTFTMANVIENVQRPTLVLSPNKTLATQLYSEFRDFFPHNAVHFFVSYYNHFRPEAYNPVADLYIEKEVEINEEINRLRLAATAAILSRRDTIIVASVSCIYGLGDPRNYEDHRLELEIGQNIKRNDLLRSLVEIQYSRNEIAFGRGNFRAKGDVIEIYPAYDEIAYRVEMFGDEIDRIIEIDTLTGEILANHSSISIFPAKHFMTDEEHFEQALIEIELGLQKQIEFFQFNGKLLEAQRIEQRTRYDLEMLRETGYCRGIENYSRHFTGLRSGEPPYCLINYFPDDRLIFIDESHVAVPQLRAMYRGDQSRKKNLVDYGFRLPSAMDNRPLRFDEFQKLVKNAIYVSATPSQHEFETSDQIAEQIIRPTGLIDPQITVHPVSGQIDHLIECVHERVKKDQRILVTTLTKRMSEDLSEYLTDAGIKANYLHSDIQTLDRAAILSDLRKGIFDVLIGINLLREGLDLPEVSLVAILDADRAGFLRSETSLIQTAGRAARNIDAEVLFYADTITPAIENTIRETNRRREIQVAHNEANGITPETISKVIRDLIARDEITEEKLRIREETDVVYAIDDSPEAIEFRISKLREQMQKAAIDLDFESAAELRDLIQKLEDKIE